MKGVKVVRAKASNAIDVYPLLAAAVKEGAFEDTPNGRELKLYYFKAMIEELAHPGHLWYVARRGRGFIGFLHAVCVPGRWNGRLESMYIDIIYVDPKYRKRGISGKLIEELKKDADHIGISKATFSCPDEHVKAFKKFGAEVTRTVMRGTL